MSAFVAGHVSAANPGTTTAPATKSVDLFADMLVAKGKDFTIKRSDLDEVMINLKSSAAAQGQNIPPQTMEAMEGQMLDRLIQIQLLLAKATDTDRNAGKEITDRRMQMMREQARTEEVLNRQLKSIGTSQEHLRSKMIEEATAQTVLERELKISVPDAEIKKFYDDNPAKFEQPEMVRTSHILFATKNTTTGEELPDAAKAAKHKQVEEVLKRARAGEDFAKLVKEYSEDPNNKDNGGEYLFARASVDPNRAMPREFENAAFALGTNEVSDIVTTQFGYHIIKLNEKIPAKKLEFAKVSADIKEYLKREQLKTRQQDFQNFIEKLRKDGGVTILEERLKLKPAPETTGSAASAPPLTSGPEPASR